MSLATYWRNIRIQHIVAPLPVLVLSLFIFYLSSIPADDLPEFTEHVSDKVLHLVAFFVYGLAAQFAIAGLRRTWSNRSIQGTALAVGAVYSLLDELHQMSVPGRMPSYTDWVADLLGLSLALLFIRIIRLCFR